MVLSVVLQLYSSADLYVSVASQTSLQEQVAELLNSRSSSSSEVDTLKHRVDETEREKRDLVGVITRLKQESAHQEGKFSTPYSFNILMIY